MKIVKILGRNKFLPVPWSNPFDVYASELVHVFSGKLAFVDTGLDMELPGDVEIKTEQIRSDIYVVGSFVKQNRLYVVVHLIDPEQYFYTIKSGDKVARIRLVKYESESVRFIDMSDNTRVVRGDAKEVVSIEENRNE